MQNSVKRPTIKDIARLAEVSVGTVSSVINSGSWTEGGAKCRVKEKNTAKVLDAINKLGYSINRKAASLRSGKNYTIAVIVPDIANNFFASISSSIWQAARNAGYMVLFLSSNENPDRLLELIDSSVCQGIDGIILAPPENCGKALTRAKNLGIPIVLMVREASGFPDMISITLDNNKAMMMAVNHLVSRGKKKIEMISSNTRISTLDQKHEAYLEAMEKNGLNHFAQIHIIDFNGSQEKITEALRNIMNRHVDGLVFTSNKSSVLCLKSLHALGYSIPEDIEVVCFDENDIFNFHTPAIPYILESTSDFGEQSFEMLHSMIKGEVVISRKLLPEIKNV